LKVGEAFNPWRRVCGFYVPDAFNRIGAVVVLRTRRKITPGHKAIYTKLVHRWGREGPCYPGQADLAVSTGSSVRAVRAWLEDLEEFGLIARHRRGRGKGGGGQSDKYVFLWHPIFDRQDSPIMTGKVGDYERQRPSVLTGKVGIPLCKEETYALETDTVTTTSGRGGQRDSPPSLPRETPEANRKRGWWSEEEFEQARTAIAKHFRRNVQPDPEITRRILRSFQGMQDFELWIAYLMRQVDPRPLRCFGFHESHARETWAGLRQEQVAQHLAVTAKAAALDAEYRDEKACREPEVLQTVLPPPMFPAPATCSLCGNSGLIERPGSPEHWTWCTCEGAVAQREREPNRVAEANAAVAKLLKVAPRAPTAEDNPGHVPLQPTPPYDINRHILRRAERR
jgi:helix-turn-helix protein